MKPCLSALWTCSFPTWSCTTLFLRSALHLTVCLAAVLFFWVATLPLPLPPFSLLRCHLHSELTVSPYVPLRYLLVYPPSLLLSVFLTLSLCPVCSFFYFCLFETGFLYVVLTVLEFSVDEAGLELLSAGIKCVRPHCPTQLVLTHLYIIVLLAWFPYLTVFHPGC